MNEYGILALAVIVVIVLLVGFSLLAADVRSSTVKPSACRCPRCGGSKFTVQVIECRSMKRVFCEDPHMDGCLWVGQFPKDDPRFVDRGDVVKSG